MTKRRLKRLLRKSDSIKRRESQRLKRKRESLLPSKLVSKIKDKFKVIDKSKALGEMARPFLMPKR